MTSLWVLTVLSVLGAREVRGQEAKGKPDHRFDFQLFGGAHFFDKDHSLGRGTDSPQTISPKNSTVFGGRLGLHFNRWVALEAEVSAAPTKTRDGSSKMWVFGYRGNVVLHLSDSYLFQPFLLAGYGGLTSLVDKSEVVGGDTWGFLHAGLGFKVGFTPWTGLRVDGRVLAPWTVLSPVIPRGDRIAFGGPDFEVLGGFYVNFGELEKVYIPVVPKDGDRDGDGIKDDVDKCPTEPEDKDGFQDEDGCPEPDNDSDRIPDALDKCPNEPEDLDGFEDQEGCPDPDNDGDGRLDTVDQCPNKAEDMDGWEDEDGCPDLDNDSDGLPDTIDKCPNHAETKNKYMDEDGCPDEIPAEVRKFTGVIEGINFKTGSSVILTGSYAILDRAVKVLKDYPEVRLEISGHTDSRGRPEMNRDLSQRRADTVRFYFMGHGIDPTRLISVGHGHTRPIADNQTASGRASNRRTEFRLVGSDEVSR
jgi:OOP family OmpA-OmpF porin